MFWLNAAKRSSRFRAPGPHPTAQGGDHGGGISEGGGSWVVVAHMIKKSLLKACRIGWDVTFFDPSMDQEKSCKCWFVLICCVFVWFSPHKIEIDMRQSEPSGARLGAPGRVHSGGTQKQSRPRWQSTAEFLDDLNQWLSTTWLFCVKNCGPFLFGAFYWSF